MSFEKLIADATTDEEMRALWNTLIEHQASAELKEAWRVRRTQIRNGTAEAAPSGPVVDSEAEPDRDELWGTALRLGGKLGWDTPTVSQRFREAIGTSPENGTGRNHQDFVDGLKNGTIR